MTTHTSTAGSEFVSAGIGRRVISGALGGVAGGLVFGMMMAMMGMLTMIAGMMGSSSPGVGFGIHMMISVVYGIVFAVIGSRWLTSWPKGLGIAMVYGIILWVVGPLIMMPMMAQTPVFAFTGTTMMSLMGHVIYALLVAVIALPMIRRHA